MSFDPETYQGHYTPSYAFTLFVNWLMEHGYSGRGRGTQAKLKYGGAVNIAQTARDLLWGQYRPAIKGYGKEFPDLERLLRATPEVIMENRQYLSLMRAVYADAAIRWLPPFYEFCNLPPLIFPASELAPNAFVQASTPYTDYSALVELLRHSVDRKFLTVAWFREAMWGEHIWTTIDADGDHCYGITTRDGTRKWSWHDPVAAALIEEFHEKAPANSTFVFCDAQGAPLSTKAVQRMTGVLPDSDRHERGGYLARPDE